MMNFYFHIISPLVAFQALLHIQALVPLKPDEAIADDDLTGNPEVCVGGSGVGTVSPFHTGSHFFPSMPTLVIGQCHYYKP